MSVTVGAMFAGYGGLELALADVIPGAHPVWVAENDRAADRVLAFRFDGAPNLGDITAVDWTAVPPVDILTGGFPCQDVSHAGRRAGLVPGTRSGLWSRMADAIAQLRPALVVAENVRGLLSAAAAGDVEPCPWCLGENGDGEPALRALGAVLADLAQLGYDAAWHGLRAADIGAPHGRFRVFIVAWAAIEDADDATRCERRLSTSAQAPRGWARADSGGRDRAPSADAGCDTRPEDDQDGTPPARRGNAVPYAESDGRDEGWSGAARIVGRSDATLGGGGSGRWGAYDAAVARWELTLGRPAPVPTELGSKGQPRLSPRFVEWMMGLPDGWVCDVPGISRNDQLRMLGNGVVPQQAAVALRLLLGHVASGRWVA